MLFVVISSPRPDQPSQARGGQKAFWPWLNKLTEQGIVKHCWNKVGRGAIVVLDVTSHEQLHLLLNQWSECVPASFEVYAVTEKEFQEQIAAEQRHPMAE